MMDEKWWMKNDGWKMMDEKWWMKNDERKMMEEKWWMKNDGRKMMDEKWWKKNGGRKMMEEKWWKKNDERKMMDENMMDEKWWKKNDGNVGKWIRKTIWNEEETHRWRCNFRSNPSRQSSSHYGGRWRSWRWPDRWPPSSPTVAVCCPWTRRPAPTQTWTWHRPPPSCGFLARQRRSGCCVDRTREWNDLKDTTEKCVQKFQGVDILVMHRMQNWTTVTDRRIRRLKCDGSADWTGRSTHWPWHRDCWWNGSCPWTRCTPSCRPTRTPTLSDHNG